MDIREITHTLSEVSGMISGLSVYAGEYSPKLENSLLDCVERIDSVVNDFGMLVYIDGHSIDKALEARREK